MFQNLLKKLEGAMSMPGVIRDCGDIGHLQIGVCRSDAKALLRKVEGQLVLTLRREAATPGKTKVTYVDLDTQGARNLGKLIGALDREGALGG